MNAVTAEVTSSCGVPAEKAFSTLQARLALRGWALTHHAAGVGFWATQWGRSRELADLDAVESFAVTVGAA